ncbi:hypothetical protein L208DRAFT_882883 [Tricholoma matsutake]|nr:hypothetical protein L208DRAFT_882883 [Tricholoma matsutake 945]
MLTSRKNGPIVSENDLKVSIQSMPIEVRRIRWHRVENLFFVLKTWLSLSGPCALSAMHSIKCLTHPHHPPSLSHQVHHHQASNHPY